MPDWPISFDNVVTAEQRLRPYLVPTPLRSYAELDEAVGLHVLIKHENHQPTNAFKVRNGLSVVTAMTHEERARGVVAATMGNYGQGLAWAGRILGTPVTICVPHTVNPDKVAAMRGLGAELVVEGKDYDDANAVVERLVRDRGLYPAHGVNHPLVLAGAGTITLEILRQAEAADEVLDAMVIVVGGGSQAVGAMTVLRHHSLDIPVFAVQASGASTIHDAWHDRKPRVGDTPTTFAEGMATRQTYDLTFDALCDGLDDFVLVSDPEMAEAIRLLLRTTHNLVEPAGAGSIAALATLADRLGGRTVAVILSGANVDLDTLRCVLNRQI
jgi:threonine dehydratase